MQGMMLSGSLALEVQYYVRDKDQACLTLGTLWYISVSMFKYVFILEPGYGRKWNVLHIK